MNATALSSLPEILSSTCPSGTNKILVLGLGNDILTDDAIGLRVVRQLGLAMPEIVRIFAVEIEDLFTLGTEIKPALQQALPAVLSRVHQALRELADNVPNRQPVAA